MLRRTRRSARVWPILLAASSAGLFAFVARQVASGAARPVDKALRRTVANLRSPALDRVSAAVTPLTAPSLLIAASLGVAFAMRGRGIRVWLPIAVSPLVAMTAGGCFSATMPQQYAPMSKEGEAESCFPSGHTTGAAAEAFTIAYVLRRHRVLGRGTAAAIALVPLVGGVNRIYRDRHWTSDIVAGMSAGAVIAMVLGTMPL